MWRIFILIWTCCAVLNLEGLAQKKETTKHQPSASLPNFRILLLDGSTLVETGSINNEQPTLFILFSADCGHCNDIANAVSKHSKALEAINVCMLATPAPIGSIVDFAKRNNLLLHEEITVGIDLDLFFTKHFKAETVPFVALYDRKKSLVSTWDKIKDLSELLNKIGNL